MLENYDEKDEDLLQTPPQTVGEDDAAEEAEEAAPAADIEEPSKPPEAAPTQR